MPLCKRIGAGGACQPVNVRFIGVTCWSSDIATRSTQSVVIAFHLDVLCALSVHALGSPGYRSSFKPCRGYCGAPRDRTWLSYVGCLIVLGHTRRA